MPPAEMGAVPAPVPVPVPGSFDGSAFGSGKVGAVGGIGVVGETVGGVPWITVGGSVG